MKKTIAFLAIACCMGTISIAQKTDDYDKVAAEIKADVWGTKDPDFESNEVPSQYKNESAIVLAKKYDISAVTNSRFGLGLLVGARKLIIKNFFRQKVIIQDKSALGNFSEVSYSKLSKVTMTSLFTRYRDDSKVFIGAKVYKNDGSIKEMAISEEVLTKNEKNNKEAKLAIPDLQVGDILDYYFVSMETRELDISLDPMQFLLSSEYPVVHFSLNGDISNRYGVEYKCLNGAPDLNINKDGDGNIHFAVKMNNLEKFPYDLLWISPNRQAMMIKLKISICGGFNHCKTGEINNKITDEDIYTEQKKLIAMATIDYQYGLHSQQRYFVRESVKVLKRRLGTQPPIDSLINTIYNSLRYYNYYETVSNNKIYPGRQRNESSIQSNYFAASLSVSLKDFDIDNNIIFYSSRYSPKLEGLMSYDQLIYMVYVKGSKDYYLTDDGIFSQCGMVSGYAEGEKGVTLEYETLKSSSKGKDRYVISQGSTIIPISPASENKSLESLKIELSLASIPTATVERQNKMTGLLKEGQQKNLMLFEDYYLDAWKDRGEEKTFIQDFADSKKTKSLADEWQNSFAKSRETYKDAFVQDLKNEYGVEPKDLISYKIDKSGVKLAEPAFQYTTKFIMQDWLKKAGNKYLFEVGKVIGNQLRIKEEDRKRTIDIYQPYARSFEYQITVTIPAGYSVEGVEALNKNIENECGLFICKAIIKGDQLLVVVKKEYAHNFEPADKWANMLAFIDAASDFGNAKVLLKKN